MNGVDESQDFSGAALAHDTEAAQELSLGARLQVAREALGLSRAEAAQAIKFSPRQIEALENETFAALPGATVVRGFIRSYARLLQMDAEPLLALYGRLAPPAQAGLKVPEEIGAALPYSGRSMDFGQHAGRRGWLVTALALVLLPLIVYGAYLLWQMDIPSLSELLPLQTEESTEAVAREKPASTVQSAHRSQIGTHAGQTAAAVETANALIASPLSGTHSTSAVVVPAQADQGAQTADSAAATPALQPVSTSLAVDPEIHTLTFNFKATAWVEVRDAHRKVIMAQNGTAGSKQLVRGRPPFAVVIGNASQVELFYEDRAVDLQPYTKVDVARFNLE